MKKFLVSMFMLFAFAGVLKADELAYDAYLADEAGLAYSKDYVLDLSAQKIDILSFQAVYSTPTAPSSFTASDGVASTGMITVSSNTALSGKYFIIGDYQFREGTHWSVTSTATGTASAIATAINGRYPLKNYITATWAVDSTTVTIKADYIGTTYNYTNVSSSPTALSVPSFTGGANTDINYTADTITENNHGLLTGMEVLYTISGSTSPSGLTSGTTYFAIPYSRNAFQLSTTSTGAVAGSYINIVSTTTPGGGTMTFVAISSGAAGGLVWQVSNDGTNYNNAVGISSATVSGAGTAIYDFDALNYKYLKAAFTAGESTIYGLKLKGYGKRRK